MPSFVIVGETKVGNSLASNLLEAGYRAAEDAPSADVIFIFTPYLEDAEDVLFGTEGVIAAAKQGACVVSLSLSTPGLAQEAFALAQVSNLHYLEAVLFPLDISREHPYADRANLVAYLGAERSDVEQVKPMLEAMSDTLVLCGTPGFGSRLASVAVAQRASSLIGTVEAYAFCMMHDTDSAACQLIKATDVLGYADEGAQKLFEAISKRRFEGDYTSAIMLGELTSILSAANENQLIIPLCEAAEYLLRLLCTIGGGLLGPAALCLLYFDEETGAQYGIDWANAEELFGSYEGEFEYFDGQQYGHYHDHDHDHIHGDEDDFAGPHEHGFGLN